MAQEGINPNNLKDTITRGGYRFVILWAAGILLLYAVGGYLGVRTLLTYGAETEKLRQNWTGSAATEPNVRAPEIKMDPGAKPVDVLVGIYMNSIGEVSLRESGWTADFDIWFRWTGDEVRPGNTFEVVNGQIARRQHFQPIVLDECRAAAKRLRRLWWRSGSGGKIYKSLHLSHLVLHQPVREIPARYDGEYLAVFHDRHVPEPALGDHLHRLADRRPRRDAKWVFRHYLVWIS